MVKSAQRVINILRAVGSNKYGISNAELSSNLNIPKGSLSLLLAELVANDFLTLRKEDRRYTLGPQIFVLAGQYLTDLDMVQLGQPIVHDLMMTTNESSALAIRKGFEMIVVYGENSSHPLRRSVEIGYRAPLYTTAVGKAMLAHLTDEEIDQYLSSVKMVPITPTTITLPETLRDELRAIRSGALAYSREEQFEGLTAMAAPVFDLHGSVVAALVVTVPTIRFNEDLEKLIEETLREASEELSRQLGFNSTSD
jgi:DNA-binding IclR family transcriptional regulator